MKDPGEERMELSCDEALRRLPKTLIARGGPTDHTLMTHLDHCAECGRELERLLGVWAELAEDADVRPSRGTRRSILAYGRAASDRGAPTRRSAVPWRQVAGLAVAGGVVLIAALSGPWRGQSTLEPITIEVGAPFPAFSAPEINSGVELALTDLRGRIVLLNVWATWCVPCEAEMPSMERLYRELGPDGFSVVALSVDQESTEKVRQWVDERGLTFTVLHDRDGVFEGLFPMIGVPESYVLDRSGVVVAREIGPRDWAPSADGRAVRDLVLAGR